MYSESPHLYTLVSDDGLPPVLHILIRGMCLCSRLTLSLTHTHYHYSLFSGIDSTSPWVRAIRDDVASMTSPSFTNFDRQ